MLKEERISNWAHACDICHLAACTVYCRADSAYLCTCCDARIHAANHFASRHERVWVCESCECAPAAFFCKADGASLCIACDSQIHSANLLATRHQRVSISPISGNILYLSMANHSPSDDKTTVIGKDEAMDEDEEEAASWLLINPGNNNEQKRKSFCFGGDDDEDYLDIMEYNSSTDQNQFADHYSQYDKDCEVHQKNFDGGGGDGVVPLQVEEDSRVHHQMQHERQSFQMGINSGYGSSGAQYSHNGSIHHSIPISSIDIGIVPESTPSEITTSSDTGPLKGTLDLLSGPPFQTMSQLTPMDREARVLRYREKKKSRRFEKTIRYASRKAYAETRPRIKGRFAKRTDISTSIRSETGYGIIPSF